MRLFMEDKGIAEGKEDLMHTSIATEKSAGANELCVSRVPLFQSLSYEQQLEVAGVAHAIHLDRAELSYSAASNNSQLLVVHTGRVKISRTNSNGHEQIIRVLGPGDFFGASAFLTGISPENDATALEDAQLCVFRHADLAQLIQRHASIGLCMLQDVSRRLGETESRLAAVISADVSSRLADYLLSLPAVASAERALEVVLPLAKKDIASLLDTTPESISRQLRSLSEARVIVQGRGNRITLLDIDALSELTNAL